MRKPFKKIPARWIWLAAFTTIVVLICSSIIIGGFSDSPLEFSDRTDLASVIFTCGVFVATFLLVFDARDSNQIELQAYVSGGGGYVIKTGNQGFSLEINNHGQTPAYLFGFAFGSYNNEAEIPEYPNYNRETKRMFFDNIPPGSDSRPVKTIDLAQHFADKPIVYARFYYKDIFGNNRSSGFISRVESKEVSAHLIGYPDYIANDIDIHWNYEDTAKYRDMKTADKKYAHLPAAYSQHNKDKDKGNG